MSVLRGWTEARAESWKLTNRNIILVGHASQHNLDVLRMVHTRVADSAISARDEVGMYSSQWGLQRLCKEILGSPIRSNKRGIHDCLKDVLARGGVVLWRTNSKEKLEAWAEVKKLQSASDEQREATKQELSSKKVTNFEREILHWSDIAEDCGWAHPDTGFDPWSDRQLPSYDCFKCGIKFYVANIA